MNKQQEWLKKHYPVSAFDLANSGADDKELLQHALAKWQGITWEELDKADLINNRGDIGYYEEGEFVEILSINTYSCTMCCKYIDLASKHKRDEKGHVLGCMDCPIAKARGGYACDVPGYHDEEDSPWTTWQLTGNPRLMIEAIENAIKYVEEHNA